MSREIPFFELFAQLQLSPELRLKLLGAVIASACIHQDTLSMELAMIVKHPLEPSDLDELNSTIRNGYGLNVVRFRVTLKEEQTPSQRKAASAPSASSGGGPTGPVLMGNPIKVKPVEMKTLDLKMGNATVSGKVFSVECVETRRPGMWRLHVEMTDYTSSVAVHKNLTEKEAKGLDGKINPGMWLCVQGKMEPTWDGKDIQLNPYHINVIQHEERQDTAPVKRVELHLHTKMSNMDALTDTKEVIKEAIRWGHPAIAITDHGVAQSFPDAWHAAGDKIKILYGVEGYFINNVDDRIAVHGRGDCGLDDEFVCFDIETTGLKVDREAITEIGAVVLKNGEIAERFQTFVNPNRRLTPEIIGLTGITDEMLKEFSYLGEDRAYEVVVKNTNMIADMCDVIRPVPRENYPPHIDGCEDDLRNMCYEKAKRIYGDPLPEPVQARLDRELGSIIGNGYAVMYIIAQKLVTKSLADGYLVGSRGSVGSSLAAFMSDITEVNSLAPHYLCPDDKYLEWHEDYSCGVDLPDKICPKCGKPLTKQGFNIPFETFLGFEGDKVPDIDLNFAGEYQSRIHWYTGEIFGHDNVFRAGTIGTVAEKTAFGYVKKYMEERGVECSRAEENRLAAGCTGVRRTSGQHPGGVVVVPKEIEIYDVCPIQHPADDPDSDIITTHFEYHSIDANLLKLDELGHDDPTIIKHLENLTGVNAQEIPLDDPETMSLFHSCKALKYTGENPDTDPILGDLGCVAVPEFGTKFVRGMVKETHPSTFAELVSISGLSHGTDVWLGNAAELVRKGIPLSGCICCRDDIMNYLILQGVKPKLSFKTMESVRKGKGLTEEMEAAMNEQHVPEWYIDSCKKIKYMFPKAHAVAYVMMAFRIAWFKVHRPLAFYSAYFSIRAKGFDASCMIKGDKVCLDKMSELRGKERDKTISAAEKDMMTTLEVCHEFYRRGFTFEPMDVYKSDATRFLVTETGLIPPFTSMPGIGEQAALSIVEERKNGKFLSAEELIVRCPKASKAVVELLEQIGALGSMPKTTQMTLF